MTENAMKDAVTDRAQLDVVVPVYNEAENIENFVSELLEVLSKQEMPYRIIFVNDGSNDATQETLIAASERHESVCYIELTRNFGKEVAITAGLDACDRGPVAIMDGDLQHPPQVILDFLDLWQQGWENVCGVRKNRDSEPVHTRSIKSLFYWLLNLNQAYKIPNGIGDFRLLGVNALRTIRNLRERNRFMKGLYSWGGYPMVTVPFEVRPRSDGDSGWTRAGLRGLALDGLTSFSTIPLRLIAWTGIIVTFLAITLAFYEIVVAMSDGSSVPGYTTLLISILFLGGVQMIALGALSVYVSKIYIETKQRPLYVVKDINVSPEREL